MQEEMQTEDELSLSDIFRAIWSRIWAIVAALVIGAAAGMGIAFLKYHNVYYYGTTIDYFVSSSSEDASGELVGNAYSESVLKQVKLLLDSDAFDRQLMAGLPEAEGIQQDTEEEREFFDLLEKTISYTYAVGNNKLSVKISALNEPDLASHLEAQVKAKLPSYIESVMNDMDGKTTTCTQLSFRPSELLNEGQTIKEMIKFGLIIGLVALIVACIAVVIVDRTDTRLRDYEELPRKFNVPVLGVIPRIETVPDDRHDVKHTEERK